MNKQKTVDSKVLAILRECPETRYDDMQLILCYYNRYSYMRVGDLPLEDIVNNYKGYGLGCGGSNYCAMSCSLDCRFCVRYLLFGRGFRHGNVNADSRSGNQSGI